MPCAPASGTKPQRRRKPAPEALESVVFRWRVGVARALAIWTAVGALMGGCAKSSSWSPKININHEVVPQPPRVGCGLLKVGMTDRKAITGAKVAIEADMSHPGMSPVFGQAKEIAPGRYQGTIQFTMPGDWVILLHITLADGNKGERQINLGSVRPS
jgi:hypothetical protein